MTLDKSCQLWELDLQGTSQPFYQRMKENFCAPLTFHPHYYFCCLEDVFLSLFFPTMSLFSFCSENSISIYFSCFLGFLFLFLQQATSQSGDFKQTFLFTSLLFHTSFLSCRSLLSDYTVKGYVRDTLKLRTHKDTFFPCLSSGNVSTGPWLY